MPANKYKFAEGEKVLCFHGPLIYEAKVNKVQLKEKVPQYFIHYSGWSKTWDEWVPESRVLKLNEAGLQKQKELQQQYPHAERPKKSAKRRSERKRASEPVEGTQTRRKRGRQDISESSTLVELTQREASPQLPEVKIVLPEELKKWLVDDWDFVTRQKQLVRLPKTVSVKDIMLKYRDHVKETEEEKFKTGQIDEICSGITDYFDVMLGTQLLYKFERPQYSDILEKHPEKASSDVYGIEHLLRLFVRLGVMLGYTPMDEDSQLLLQTHIQDFLKFLESSKDLFTMEYDAAPPEYHRRLA